MYRSLNTLIAALASLTLLATTAAAETRTFAGYDGPVEIPREPQRIVALNDHVLAMPLIELGAPLVASTGRLNEEGETYLRGVKDLLGVDFGNSAVEFIGTYSDPDMEKIVAVEPDLIVAFNYHDASLIERMRRIAPTVVIDAEQPILDFMHDIAEVGGVLDEYQARLARYQDRLAEARAIIPEASDIRVSVIQANDGALAVYRSYGALGQVIEDLGFDRPEEVANIDGDYAQYSAESLPDFDGDFVFDTYRISAGDMPADARARMAEVLPNWCQVLHACRNQQYVVLPRTFVYSSSFASLELNIQFLTSHIGGRDFVPYER